MKNWIIALSVALVYLLVSVWSARWDLTWLIWAAYAAYRLLEGKRPADHPVPWTRKETKP